MSETQPPNTYGTRCQMTADGRHVIVSSFTYTTPASTSLGGGVRHHCGETRCIRCGMTL